MSMTILYYKPNGRITAMKDIQPWMIEENAQADDSWFEIPGYIDDYDKYVTTGVDGPEITTRPAMALTVSSTAVGINEDVTVSGVPTGTLVHHPDGSNTVNDGTLEWSSTLPGVHRLILENFPYQDEEITIEVTS